jgi:outer membrane protein assembly factor BamD (BamD/ComL family)
MIDRGRVVAGPRWPFVHEAETATPRPNEAVAPAAPSQVGASPFPEGAVPATPAERAVTGESSPPVTSADQTGASDDSTPEEYVRRAKQEFDAGRVEQALAILELMKRRYPFGTDEAWWLFGQLYEANSPARDIRLSLEYYRRLVNDYPLSSRVDDARRRIAYLERYYFNIR